MLKKTAFGEGSAELIETSAIGDPKKPGLEEDDSVDPRESGENENN